MLQPNALSSTPYSLAGDGIGRRHHDLALVKAGRNASYRNLVAWMAIEIKLARTDMKSVSDRARELLGADHPLIVPTSQGGHEMLGPAFVEARNGQPIQ